MSGYRYANQYAYTYVCIYIYICMYIYFFQAQLAEGLVTPLAYYF